MTLFHFGRPEHGDVERLFHWRCDHRVARTLVGDPPGDLAAHRLWFDRLEASDQNFLWIVWSGGSPIGQVNIADLDVRERCCEWGFYIGEEAHLGLGGLIPPYLYNRLFLELSLRSLRARVLSNNEEVLTLHRYHGYRKTTLDRKCLVRDGEALDLHHLILTRETWQAQTRFHRFRADFQLPASVLARLGISASTGEY